jgi:hypothetical protein
MTTIRVHFDNGDTITTDINGTRADIRAYYEGQTFNLGSGEDDLMATATSVEFFEQVEA